MSENSSEMSAPTPPVADVIGGGISGLVTAWKLRQKGFRVQVWHDPESPALISSRLTPLGLVETAANGFLASPVLVDLCRELDLELISPLPSARKRFLENGRGPERWPLSLGQTFAVAGRFLLRYLTRTHRPRPLETLEAWGARVMGLAFTHKILSVAVQGIYAVPARHLSAGLVLRRFFEKRKATERDVKPSRRPRGLVSFREGMGALPKELRARLEKDPQVSFRAQKAEPQDLQQALQEGHWVFVATKAHEAAKLSQSLSPSLQQAFSAIQMLPLVTCTVFFRKVATDPQGFGVLRSETMNQGVSGILWNSCLFAERSRPDLRSETWILTGPSWLSMPDSEIRQIIEVLQGRTCEGLEITRWPQALPCYSPSLEKVQAAFREPPLPSLERLRFVGNYVNGIGLTQICEDIENQIQALPTALPIGMPVTPPTSLPLSFSGDSQ